MSFKAKDLSYDAKEPAFLRRLRGEVAGVDTDRHSHSVARPRRAKPTDDDDGPTYVVEESNDTLSRAEYEALLSEEEKPIKSKDDDVLTKESEGPPTAPAVEAAASADGEGVRVKQQVAEAGKGQRKRKAVKVVGDADDGKEEGVATAVQNRKPKRQAKAIKLSFGDDEQAT